MRDRDYQLVLGLILAGLTIAVIVLAVQDRGTRDSRVGTLTERVAKVEKQLAANQRATRTLSRNTTQRLADVSKRLTALRKALANVSRRVAQRGNTGGGGGTTVPLECLRQIQQEIDDIRAYIAFRHKFRRRVAGQCVALLQPRYGG